MLSYKVQSSKYRETVKTVEISISNNKLNLNRVMYFTYIQIMSKTATWKVTKYIETVKTLL
jgi:hypothetical protein